MSDSVDTRVGVQSLQKGSIEPTGPDCHTGKNVLTGTPRRQSLVLIPMRVTGSTLLSETGGLAKSLGKVGFLLKVCNKDGKR